MNAYRHCCLADEAIILHITMANTRWAVMLLQNRIYFNSYFVSWRPVKNTGLYQHLRHYKTNVIERWINANTSQHFNRKFVLFSLRIEKNPS